MSALVYKQGTRFIDLALDLCMYIYDRVNEKLSTSLPARSVSKQVFDHSHGSVRASQHILQQQLVREHLQQ